MLRPNLSAADLEKFHQGLRTHHTRTVQVELQNLDGNTLDILAQRVIDGQVTVDMDADVTRSLTLTLLDPNHSLDIDSASPDAGAMFADRMLRVSLSYRVATLPGERVTIPVFTGPVTKLSRTGPTVEVEAQGKELLAMGAVWAHPTIRQGTLRAENIEMLLRDYAGERFFEISPNLQSRQPQTVTMAKYGTVWQDVQTWAKGMNAQLFYDGEGVARLRGWPGQALWTFRTGPGGDILTQPEVHYTTEELINLVEVTGGVPKGKTAPVVAQAVAPAAHPLSPQSLGRRTKAGRLVPRYLVERIEDDSIRTQAEALELAKRTLNDRLLSTVEVAFDALPIPHLDPGDMVAADLGSATVQFRLKKFTIPLGVGDGSVMSVGYLKNVHVNRKAIRG